jgi:hypothetical protein
LFGRFCGSYGPVRLPTSVHRCRAPLGFAARTLAPSAEARHGISRFPCGKLPYVRRVLDHAGPKYTLLYRCILFCLPIGLTSSTPQDLSFRGSIPGPHFPLSTLRLQALQLQTHDSGPMWVANPSSYGTFIHYFPPVFTGAPNLSHGLKPTNALIKLLPPPL